MIESSTYPRESLGELLEQIHKEETLIAITKEVKELVLNVDGGYIKTNEKTRVV